MGGRGTYSLGQSPAYTYKTVGMIGDTKILIPIDQTKALKLPEESHTRESKYVLFDKEGANITTITKLCWKSAIILNALWEQAIFFTFIFTESPALTITITKRP